MSNIDKIIKDLDELIKTGNTLLNVLLLECNPKYTSIIKKDPKSKKLIEKTGGFRNSYQNWYSESVFIIKLLLQERLIDFIKFYEVPKARKNLNIVNYCIEDYLCGFNIPDCNNKILHLYQQQLKIVESLKRKFQSSLFDLQTILQADLYDSELDAAKELNNKGFTRGAGAMAGVVLEHHLSKICNRRNIEIGKKDPGIGYYNGLLKNNNIIETHIWRNIQHLADLRNLCDHKMSAEPTQKNIAELISGVDKILKNIS